MHAVHGCLFIKGGFKLIINHIQFLYILYCNLYVTQYKFYVSPTHLSDEPFYLSEDLRFDNQIE